MNFAETIKPAMVTPEDPTDYVKDGILHCGQCNTPKQALLSLPALTGTATPKLFPIACQCRQEARDKAAAKRRAEEFRNNLESSWRADGFHDQSYLVPTFAADDGTNSKISDVCRKYVERWPEMREKGIGLLLYGGIGSGKTFFAGCICNALLEKRVRVCATSFPRVLNTLQATFDRQEMLDHLAQYSCLLLDDFGVERGTEYAMEQLFAVVDARYRAKRPTIITTNLSLQDLEKPQNLAYGRIFDRILEMCPVRLCVSGPSRRKDLAEERRTLARQLLL